MDIKKPIIIMRPWVVFDLRLNLTDFQELLEDHFLLNQ